ncbi:YbhB/YbcL family Raf kinase inhibitor-like protein [Halomicrococcus sp. SG-WS-1]|uniref:YbhB/YbcL family Raf kinase inhibitor-like protein n=1 Tax=Halomicrococcus sp. SG-WS-1 TaxID=3439057 RepID=UPI003F7AD4AD
MLGRRGFVRAAVALASGGATTMAGCAEEFGGETDKPPGTATTTTSSTRFGTPAFEDGGTIPKEYTCAGADRSPRLEIGGVTGEAESLAVVVDDPDAPSGVFTHWLLWDVPPDTTTIPKDVPTTEAVEDLGGAKQGENDFGEIGYRGPCPPKGSDPHTYRFTLYVLERRPRIGAGASRNPLLDELEVLALGTERFTGEFGR